MAQRTPNPGAVATENGLFVYCGGKIPKDGYFLIERKGEREKQFSEVQRITVPSSMAEIETRATATATQFNHLAPLTKDDQARIYAYLHSNEMDDSLYRSRHLPLIAITAGTAFLDTLVKEGKAYQYRVTLFKGEAEIFTEELEIIQNTVIKDPSIPSAVDWTVVNDDVSLEWRLDEEKNVAHFNVFRSFFGVDDYQKIATKKGFLNDEDGLHIIVIDTSTELTSLYKYRIELVDLYGIPTAYSEVITAGKLNAQPLVPFTSLRTEAVEGHKIKLSWKLEKSALASNIQVWRSDNYDDGFTNVMNLPPASTEFMDHLPQASENYYYYLKINGSGGQEFKSSKIAAMIKTNDEVPEKPKNITGLPTTNGIEVSWVFDEAYTRGVYVYRSTSGTDQFNQISNLIPANNEGTYAFVDTSSAMKAGQMYRYTVRAENDSYVFGEFSDTVHVMSGKKPKIEAPQNLESVVRDSVIEIYWKDMHEHSEYVLGYKIYRNDGGSGAQKLLKNDTLNPDGNYFNDMEVEEGKTYSYQVSTIDIYGQESLLSLATVVTLPSKSTLKITPKKPRLFKNSKGVQITWNQISLESVEKVKVYRTELNQDPQLVKEISIDKESCLDDTVEQGKLYYYTISFLTKDGIESNHSGEASIHY